jgi:hypothetical protein
MRKSVRFALLAAASVMALALAGTALAAYRPYLTIYEYSYKLAASPSVEIDYEQKATEPAPARAVFVVPAGYAVDLTQSPGTTIGFVIANIKTGASSTFAGAVLRNLTGPITVVNPGDYAVPAAQCTGNPVHTAVWTLTLAIPGVTGQDFVIPAYVDKPGPAGTAASITFCLPNPNIPESSGGARFGAFPLNVSMTFRGAFHVFTNPSSATFYTWSAFVTPWPNGPGAPISAETVEARANVPIPYSTTLRRVATKKGSWHFAGKLTGGGGPFVREKLDVYEAATVAGLGRLARPTFRTRPTTKKGTFTFTRKATRTARYFQTVFGPFDVTTPNTCGGPTTAPAGCTTATLSEVDSNIVKAPGVKTKPRKKRR